MGSAPSQPLLAGECSGVNGSSSSGSSGGLKKHGSIATMLLPSTSSKLPSNATSSSNPNSPSNNIHNNNNNNNSNIDGNANPSLFSSKSPTNSNSPNPDQGMSERDMVERDVLDCMTISRPVGQTGCLRVSATSTMESFGTGTNFVYVPSAEVEYLSDKNKANAPKKGEVSLLISPGSQNPDKSKFIYFIE